MKAHSEEEAARRQQAARQIVLQHLRKVAAGQSASPEDVLARYPELREELAEEFQRQNLAKGPVGRQPRSRRPPSPMRSRGRTTSGREKSPFARRPLRQPRHLPTSAAR